MTEQKTERTTRKQLIAQTPDEHRTWLDAQYAAIERRARKFSDEISVYNKTKLIELCGEYGVTPSTPMKMRVALVAASRTSEYQAVNEMHKMWIAAPR